MAKFDLHKATGLNNVMNAVQQVKDTNNILPLSEAKALSIENLYPSAENFYSVEELDELADSIRELGILQPLLVSERENGRYEIIAGNRRYEAAKMAGLERLPCLVKQHVEPVLFKIMLIHANMFRVKTDMERAIEVAELKKAIAALKSVDKSIKGRTSEIAGQILNLSYRQVNRLDNLNKLIPEMQGLVQRDRLTASCAEQFAHLGESVQKEIYEALIISGMDINRQEATKIKEEFQAKEQALREEQIRQPKTQKELEKVKRALVAALQDRAEIEERYNALSAQKEDSNEKPYEMESSDPSANATVSMAINPHTATLPAADTEQLLNDIKRKVQLQECISRLKLAMQSYVDYKHLYRLTAPTVPPETETAMHNEMIDSLQRLSKLVAGTQE